MAEEQLCEYLRGLNPAALGKALNTPELGPRILFHSSWCAACSRKVGPVLDEITERAAEEFNCIEEQARSRAATGGGGAGV